MKKNGIWILIFFMTVTFVGLLLLQLRYINQSSNMVREQFGDAVRRSLYRVVCDVEEDEVRKIIDQTLADEVSCNMEATKEVIGDYRDAEESSALPSVFFSERDSLLVPGEEPYHTVKPQGKGSLQNMNKAYNARYYERFMRSRSLLDVVTARLMKESPNRDITERVDMESLDDMIKTCLHYNGIDLDFHFMVIDQWNNIVYSCHGDKDISVGASGYRQRFFPREKEGRVYYLYLSFPEEEKYFSRSLGLVIPSVLLSLLLFATYVLTILYIFRQKWLNEMKNDFVNNMTHELKTPVSSISLAAQMLNDPAVNKSPVLLEHISHVIRDETKRLSFQVEKVLQMSVFDRDRKATFNFREMDINEMIENIVGNFSLKVQAKGGRIKSKLVATNSVAEVDEMHFGNVIYNLMDNAVKYSRADVPVILVVSTWNEKNMLCISVEDNGVGIKKEYQKHIFDKFYRVPTGNRHDVKGFGLGLSYVKRIVTEHGGSIKVESEENVGTKFIIEIPTVQTK